MAFDDNPADDSYELDQCLDELIRVKAKLVALEKLVAELQAAWRDGRPNWAHWQLLRLRAAELALLAYEPDVLGEQQPKGTDR